MTSLDDFVTGQRPPAKSTLTQDPLRKSKRVGSAGLAILTAVLADPTVQQGIMAVIGVTLGPYAPIVTAILSAALAIWSKQSDKRPKSS